MPSILEVLSLILVGALWGITNPFLRQQANNENGGATESASPQVNDDAADGADSHAPQSQQSWIQSIFSSLAKFRRFGVWLAFLLNQSGSIMFYYSLANSDISLAVPICNGLSLLFSIVTSNLLGERVDQPIRTMVGAALVVGGVAVCLATARDEENTTANTLSASNSHLENAVAIASSDVSFQEEL
jgi:drug/metabolite transporter (DMT)-like permease